MYPDCLKLPQQQMVWMHQYKSINVTLTFTLCLWPMLVEQTIFPSSQVYNTRL